MIVTQYDTAELWSSNDNAVQLILKYIAIHEFVHWVWFDDGDDPGEHPYAPALVTWYDKNLMQAVQTHDSWSLKEAYL